MKLEVVKPISNDSSKYLVGGKQVLLKEKPKLMPYHLKAMESNWDSLTSGMKVMSLNFMKVASAGFISTSIAICSLLFFPFRNGESWAIWALPIVSLSEIFILLYRLIDVSRKTPSKHKPNIAHSILMIVIIVFSFILSILA